MNKTNQHIALFPLKLFLLPGEHTQLYIFEERYKQLINDCYNQKVPFGISFTGIENQANIGTMVEVSEILEVYPGGEMNVIVKATGLFKLLSFNMQQSGKLYPGGDVDLTLEIENLQISDSLSQAYIAFLKQDEDINANQLSKSRFLILGVAGDLMMSDSDKLDFCLCTSHSEREKFLLNYIRYIYFLEEQEASVYHNIYLN